MAEDGTTPGSLATPGTPVTQAQFNTLLQVINLSKEPINKQFINLNDKAAEQFSSEPGNLNLKNSIGEVMRTNIILTKMYM